MLPLHAVTTARAMGWELLSNGNLLAAAEDAGFELLFTTDRRIQYQQNLKSRKIAILVLSGTTKWSQVRLHVARISSSLDALEPSGYLEVFIPFRPKPRYNPK